jgi:redox-sensing transcriptional repressor
MPATARDESLYPNGQPLGRNQILRLSHYHDFLREWRQENPDAGSVSSQDMAEFVGVDSSQVRRDMAAIGATGCPRVGFRVGDVLAQIREVLGMGRRHRGAVLGAGRLGSALASFAGLRESGLDIVAVLDTDPRRIGDTVGALTVRPVDDLDAIVAGEGVRVAVLAVPVAAAQEATDRAVRAGIRAFWNFAPVKLDVPPGVAVRYENIAQGLTELFHRMARMPAG